jgi:propanol-preferring alcohol dehydrogenase
MATMMKAAVVRAFGQPLSIEQVPIPTPGPGQLLVQVMACGVCDTDLHAVEGDWPVKPALPFIPGHEVAGVVAALGSGVTGFKVGDAVGVGWLHDACRSCEYCETGWETLCEHQHNTGYSCDGGFAQYCLAEAAFAARLPAHVDFAGIAPILGAGVSSYKGLKETEARPGQWVVISGVGGLGHLAIQYARIMGLRVVALDIAADKLARARAYGAEMTVDAGAADAKDLILAKTGGGAHGVLVTAASAQAFTQALEIVRRKGVVTLVGLPPSDVPMPIFDVVLKRITVRGSIVGTRRDLDEALAFATEGRVRADITTAPLEDINAIFADMKSGVTGAPRVLDLSPGVRKVKAKLIAEAV